MKFGSDTKNMMSDFAQEIAKYLKKTQIAHNGIPITKLDKHKISSPL